MQLRLIPGWTRLVLFAAPLVIAFGALAGAYAYRSSVSANTAPPPNPPVSTTVEIPPPSGLLVYVSGAVEHPGLYRLKRGDRAFEAIAAAGDAEGAHLVDPVGEGPQEPVLVEHEAKRTADGQPREVVDRARRLHEVMDDRRWPVIG